MTSTGSCLEQGPVTTLMEPSEPGNFLTQPLHKKDSITNTTQIHKLLLYLLTPLPKPISGAVCLTTVYGVNKSLQNIYYGPCTNDGPVFNFMGGHLVESRSRLPRRLRRGCKPARLLGLRVRIPLRTQMSFPCELCVIIYRSLQRADHSSRGVLPSAVCRRVIEESHKRNLGPLRLFRHEVKKSCGKRQRERETSLI
jgi:hypothetical protein